MTWGFTAQIIKNGKFNERYFNSSWPYKPGTELSNYMGGDSIYPVILTEVFQVMNLISSLPRIEVTEINYSIKKMPESKQPPDLGSISLSINKIEGLEHIILHIDSIERNAKTIAEIVKPNIKDLAKKNNLIGNNELEVFIKENIQGTAIDNIIDINNSSKQLSEDYNKSNKHSYGTIIMKLEKDLICPKECSNSNYHNNLLSELLLEKPWDFKGGIQCFKCDAEYVITAAYPIINYKIYEKQEEDTWKEIAENKMIKGFDQNKHKIEYQIFNKKKIQDDVLSYAILHSCQLGEISTRIAKLTLSREFSIENNLSNLLVLPKNIKFEKDGEQYLLEFEELSERRFKNTLSRGKNNRLRYTVYKI